MSELRGQCHCGAVKVAIEAEADDLPLRACQCGFCRRHGAVSTSRPDARITISARPGTLTRYRFAQKLSDYLICQPCGCYVGAATQIDDAWYAILNVRGVDLPGFDDRTPEPMVYDGETPETRTARRKARWSPAAVAEIQPSA
jgi:hypothetical protein